MFEAFCAARDIKCSRIPESREKSPDYEVILLDRPVAVEIKQLEPNASDREIATQLATLGRAAFSVEMGRARDSITAAVKQLRPYTEKRIPGIVVLHDATGTANYLDPYNIAYCLYGAEKVRFSVPADPRQEIQHLGMSRGGGSVATPKHNTTLSAVGVLRHGWEPGELVLAIFHNLHAAVPLRWEEVARYGIPQFRFGAKDEGRMPEWLPC